MHVLNRLHLLSIAFAIVLFINGSIACADEAHFQYLPKDLSVDPSIPTPKQHLGFRIGERHIQHHQLVSYLRRLAKLSPRISLKVYAYTHGGRPCVMLTITSPANHKRLDKIRSAHKKLAVPALADQVETEKLPAVINMGYGVHGDESSASNASAVVAYYLAAARGKQIDRILGNCVVLLDPSLNPDGFNRFASWANGHVGRIQNPDPNHAEHNQPFPGGRVNYYWFDLNRDWLPAQHPESRGRLKQFHAWKPNVVLDFHEMGTNSTYFFQPGIPTRNNPLTPRKNYDLTREMSIYHAKALDKIGSLYMTEERFDDFYMGKGSTYPDLHGSVGILFEQASSRGHRQDTPNGQITFPFTIRNQVTTSLSSLNATVDMREKLLAFKKEFYVNSLEQARKSTDKFLIFRCEHDQSRLRSFAEVLLRHDIQVFLQEDDSRKEFGQTSLVVPCQQPEYRFLLSLIEKRTQFQENIFYDVSTWHLPSAFGVTSEFVATIDKSQLQKLSLDSVIASNSPEKDKQNIEEALAYAIDWRSYKAPTLLGRLLADGIKVRVARKPFSIRVDDSEKQLPHGTLLVPIGIQPGKKKLIQQRLSSTSVPTYPIQSGLTPRGIDVGSSQFAPVTQQKVAMLIGDGVNRYEAGEVWHLFDTRLQLPLSMLKSSSLSRVQFDKYTTIVLVSGSYSTLSEKTIESLSAWVEKGGNLVLTGSSVTWANTKGLIDVKAKSASESSVESEMEDEKSATKTAIQKPFDQARNDAALKLISGAIFETKIDTTHPIGYGYSANKLQVFRNNKVILEPSSDLYKNAVVYTDNPQVAGYCSQENVEVLKNSAAAISIEKGRGSVIVIPQNPNFRGFWYGTNRLFFNAVYFGEHTN